MPDLRDPFECSSYVSIGVDLAGVNNVKNHIQMVFLVKIIGVQFRHHTLIYTLHTHWCDDWVTSSVCAMYELPSSM